MKFSKLGESQSAMREMKGDVEALIKKRFPHRELGFQLFVFSDKGGLHGAGNVGRTFVLRRLESFIVQEKKKDSEKLRFDMNDDVPIDHD